MAEYHKIIFVCTENTTISPMAETIFKSFTEGMPFEVISRGLVVLFSEPVHPLSQKLLTDHGFTAVEHFSCQLAEEDLDGETLVLTMTFSQKVKVIEELHFEESVYTVSEFIGEDEDLTGPYGGTEEEYEEFFKDLTRKLRSVSWKLKGEEI